MHFQFPQAKPVLAKLLTFSLLAASTCGTIALFNSVPMVAGWVASRSDSPADVPPLRSLALSNLPERFTKQFPQQWKSLETTHPQP